MGPPPSIESMTEMLSNPNFAQMMNEALQNPQLVDMMIQQNPQLRAMGPQARQMLQSEQFRQMITNPQALQQMAQLSRTMGLGPFGGEGGASAFPMPGATSTTPAENRDAGTTTNTGTGNTAQQNPFAALLGGGGAGVNPFAALMNPPQPPSSDAPQGTSSPPPNTAGSQNPPNPFAILFNPPMTGQGANPSNNPTSLPPNPFQNNPFLQDPASMAALMQAMGGTGGAAGGDGHANAMQNLMNILGGAPPPPTDSRPPEERYATQLRQLNEMGFYEFERNIQALTRSGGDVNGALEWLFNQPSR
jgi:ubiquilin